MIGTRVLFAASMIVLAASDDPRTPSLHAASPQAASVQPEVAAQTIRIGVLTNGSYDVVTAPLEDYVGRVLAGEAVPDSPAASLEALAIAVRTYTAANRNRHASEGFDLCDQTHCQVMRTARPETEAAARATASQVLTFRGAPATVFYSASCGGRSEKPSNVWPGETDREYLTIHEDDGCEGFPMWTSELTDADLQRALVAAGYRGRLRDVRVLARNDSGRVARLALAGMQPDQITGQDLRMAVGRTLGFQHIASTAFQFERTRRGSRFTGHGSGHGVGMCVIGSMKLAAKGETASAILARYFPGTDIGRYSALPVPTSTAAIVSEPPLVLPPSEPAASPLAAVRPTPPVSVAASAPAIPGAGDPSDASALSLGDAVVVLPDAEASERPALTALVVRERQAMAAELAVSPARVRVRFHESNESFERASGRSWFHFGVLVGFEIQLAPLRVLRGNGMLERTLRRQLVHLMADSELPERPAWVREGAAVYFADGDTVNTARVICPQDDELRRPVSIGALGDAWGRARACFERQLTSGRDWRRVR